MEDRGESRILFVISCSNRKIEGGENYPADALTLGKLFGSGVHDQILERRRRVHRIITGTQVRRNRRLLGQLPYNRSVRIGPDLGGAQRSSYREAFRRYAGRLYSEIPGNIWRAKKHHVLIISGLYGLILPEEPIQRYSCHVSDDKRIADAWVEGRFLTLLLNRYVTCFSIARIFDLTGETVYRKLVDWSALAKAEILHVFGEQNAGPAVLPAFGSWLSRALVEEESALMGLQQGDCIRTPFENLRLSTEAYAPRDCPDEESEFISQLEKYLEIAFQQGSDILEKALGGKRWKLLGEIEPAREFLVSAYSIYRCWREIKDHSPVCVQICKALETVLDAKFFRSAGEALGVSALRCCGQPLMVDLIRATKNKQSLSLGKIGAILSDIGLDEIRRMSVQAYNELLPLKCAGLSVRELGRQLCDIARKYRNGLAHNELGQREKADECIGRILGNVQENPPSLLKPGLLIRILDAAAERRKAY